MKNFLHKFCTETHDHDVRIPSSSRNWNFNVFEKYNPQADFVLSNLELKRKYVLDFENFRIICVITTIAGVEKIQMWYGCSTLLPSLDECTFEI